MIVKQINLFLPMFLSKKIIYLNKIIIISLIAIAVLAMLNSSNLVTEQIVYAQTVIDTINVNDSATVSEFNPVNEELFVANKGNISSGRPDEMLYLSTNNLIYILNNNGSISILDPITNKVKKNINFGNIFLHGLEFVPYKNSIYVGNGYNKISEIDVVANTIVGNVSFSGSTAWMRGIVFSPVNNYLYGLDANSPRVIVIDTSNNTVVTTIPIIDKAYGIEFVPSINKLYVTHYDRDSISVIDTKTNNVTNIIENVGNYPLEIIYLPQINLVYVSLYLDSKVIAINPISNKLVATISVGTWPWNMIFDSNNHLYVTRFGNDSISVIDTKINNIKHTIKNISNNPRFLEFVPKSNMLYITNDVGIVYISTEFLQIRDTAEKDDEFGGATDRFHSATLAAGDFNKDGYRDLAVGVPGEDVIMGGVNIKDAGIINVIYGSITGLRSIDNQVYHQGMYQGNHQILDSPESDDRFGSVLAAGDFNKDGYFDLAVGVPNEDVKIGEDNRENAGIINVIFGSNLGLTAANNQVWYQGNNGIVETAEPHDYFGSALAAGNFGHGSAHDLAIGVPDEDIVNKRDAGIINVIYGSSQPEGLRAVNNQIWYQGYNGILETVEQDDGFGNALAAGDFNNTGVNDLVIGVPGEDVRIGGQNRENAGMINVIYGTEYGLRSANNQIWYPGYNGILEPQFGSHGFGWTLAAGNFGKDNADDLAIGAPTGGLSQSGSINVIYGSTTGLTSTGNQIWYQGYNGIGDGQEIGQGFPEGFGWTLAAGNVGKDNADDLVIGVPGEDNDRDPQVSIIDAGMIHVIYGSTTGLTSTGNQKLSQSLDGRYFDNYRISNNILYIYSNDRFSNSLAAGDFNNTGFDDLAVGVPGEDQETTTEMATSIKLDSGVVKVIYGSSNGLNLNRNNIQLWSQDTS
jgi:YVTN family beta-propeller protein